MKKAQLATASAAAFLAITTTAVIVQSRETRPSPRLQGTDAPAPVELPAANATPTAAFKLALAPTGNSARYLVQEQLVGVDLPSQAIGETKAITGEIAFDSAGQVIATASRIQVDVSGLRSDSDRRDGFVRARVLETDRYPLVTFVPTRLQGITLPLPASGARTFSVVGNLTIHGVTRRATWRVQASFNDDRITGTASTSFAFADFALTQPRVPVVLSVADTIQLEHRFALLRENP